MLEMIVLLLNSDLVAPVYASVILSAYLLGVYQLMKKRRIGINFIVYPGFWLLFLSGILFAVSYPKFLNYSLFVCLVLYGIEPLLLYGSGCVVALMTRNDCGERILKILYAIAIGCGINVVLSIIANLGVDRWHTVNFLGIRMAATNLASTNTYIFSLLPCIMITKNKKLKLIGFLLFGLSVVYSFILGTRTQLFLCVIVVCLSAIAYFISHYKGRIPSQKTIKLLFAFAGLILVFLAAFGSNFLGIRDKILQSNLLYRFIDKDTSGSDYYRMGLFFQGIQNLVIHPFGGNTDTVYFHNYWLDIGRVAGVAAVLLVAAYDCIIMVHVIKIFKNRQIKEELRFAFLFLHIGLFLNFFMEPIMEGYLSILFRSFFLNGIVEGLYYDTHKSNDLPSKYAFTRKYRKKGVDNK